MSIEPIIKLENVSVVYLPGKSNETWGIRDINISIYPKEYIILFGPSGSGKSTILNIIAGLEKPSKGSITVDGKNISKLSDFDLINFHRTTIGIIFQAFYLISSLNIRDNILLPKIFSRSGKTEREDKLKILADRFQISNYLNKHSNELSGGQQQRVAAARALINDPEIILADEPVGNLDTKNAEITMQLLAELNEKDKKTVILVTHDPRYLPYAHRVFYLKDGQIIRETVNTRKSQSKKDGFSGMLEKIAEIYPFADESTLKTKLVLNQVLLGLSLEEQDAIEEIIHNFISKTSTEDDFVKSLVGLEINGVKIFYKDKAISFANKIVKLKDEMSVFEGTIKDKTKENTHPLYEKVITLRKFLLDQYDGHITLEAVGRLDKGIYNRLKGECTSNELETFLDLPFSTGGVGLNKRTARNFRRQIDLVLSGN